MEKTNKDNVIDEIIEIDFEMFVQVNNRGGKAQCQSDYEGFKIYRYSYYYPWSLESLKIYLAFLKECVENERNIMTEKYAYMMETTHPEEFMEIKKFIPEVREDKNLLINLLWEVQKNWIQKFSLQYPNILKHGRPITSRENNNATSIENYFKSELKTYTMELLNSLEKDHDEYLNSGKSMVEKQYEIMMKLKGFSSLEEAEMYARG